MAVNLVEQFGRHRSRELLETSFAQFQADRSVVGISRQVQRNEEGLDGYQASHDLPPGRLRGVRAAAPRAQGPRDRTGPAGRGTAPRRGRRLAGEAQAGRHHPCARPASTPASRWCSTRAARRARQRPPRHIEYHDGPRPLVLTAERQVKRLASMDFPVPVEALERMRIPKSFNPRSRSPGATWPPRCAPRPGTSCRSGHRKQRAPGGRRPRDRPAAHGDLRAHPCHGCDEREDHARWAERYHRLQPGHPQLERRIEGRTNTIARTFDRIVRAADRAGLPARRRGHRARQAAGPALRRAGPAGQRVPARRASGRGSARPNWPPASRRLVYEARQSDDAVAPKLPSGTAKAALGEMVRIWGRLDALEEDHRITQTEGVGQREPDLGFAWAAYMWASGKGLDEVLREAEMPAGDFVRWCKQVIDVLGQISAAASGHPGWRGSTVAKNCAQGR